MDRFDLVFQYQIKKPIKKNGQLLLLFIEGL